MKQQRNSIISICKGIAIILMVFGHCEGPAFITRSVYLYHMPVFFMAAGYFFSRKYLSDPWTFVKKRFKGLYVPMVKWSVFFLIIHNLCFKVGLLSEKFGNWNGGVTHPYNAHDFMQRLVNIFTSMSGYDEFLVGAFWFFRALLIASIAFLVLYLLLDGRWKWLKGNGVVAAVCLLTLGFALFKIGNGLKITNISQGGNREVMGVFFFGLGLLYHKYQDRIRDRWYLALLGAAIVGVGNYLGWHGMNVKAELLDVITLPVTGMAGWLMVHYVASVIDRHNNVLKRFLVHCGEMTIYIYVFHIIAFKVVSAIKIWYYGLDWGQLGCHMVVHEHSTNDAFFILYTMAGVGLPLLWMAGYRKLKGKLPK